MNLRNIIDQCFVCNIVETTNSILIDDGHLKIGQINYKTLLYFQYAFLKNVISFILRYVCTENETQKLTFKIFAPNKR